MLHGVEQVVPVAVRSAVPVEGIKGESGHSARRVRDGQHAGKRVHKGMGLQPLQLVRPQELQAVADAVVREHPAHAGDAAHMPVEVFVKQPRAGGPDVVVGPAHAQLLRRAGPRFQRSQRCLERVVPQVPGVEVRRHGHQPPLQAEVPHHRRGLRPRAGIVQNGGRRAQARDAARGAQRGELRKGARDAQHGGVQHRIHASLPPLSPRDRCAGRDTGRACSRSCRRRPWSTAP